MRATRADSGQEEPDRISLDASASGHGRIYQAGRDQTVNEITLPDGALRPVEEVVAPHGLVNVPGRSPVFVGRGDELAELSAVLDVEHGGVVIAAVHGLGGVGKSTLAARYAVTAAGEANPVWWITADTIEAVQAGLAGLTVALQPELSSLPLKVLAALSPLDDQAPRVPRARAARRRQ